MRPFLALAASLIPIFAQADTTFSPGRLKLFYETFVCEEKDELSSAGIGAGCSFVPTPTPTPSPTTTVPPAPKLGYAPILISNNTGIPSDQIYFLATGKALTGSQQHFLQPNLKTGVCAYALPSSYNSADPTISVKLSQLPRSGKGTHLIYIPQQISGRCYLSINTPLYLQTTDTTIASPSVTSYTDPNFYTLYQDFELTLDSKYDLYANISNVDFYSLPMGLSSFSYPSGSPYATLDGLLASGFSETTTRQSVLTTVSGLLSSGDHSATAQWSNLVIPFYSDPYTVQSPLTTLRILAAKNSLSFGTSGSTFLGAANTQGFFSSTYLQNAASGPAASTTYMQQWYNYYLTNSTEFTIYPASEAAATYTMSSSGTSGILNLTAGSGAPTDITLNLNYLSTIALLAGDVGVWNTGVDDVLTPGGTGPWNTEIAKLLSAMFSAGLLPPNTTMTQPILDSDVYFANYRNLYFTYPSTLSDFTGHGPWFNLFDSAMHPLMIKTSGYGLGYAFDYDDLLDLGGEMHVNIQTSGTLNPKYPYYQLYAGPVDTSVPDPTVNFGPYALTIESNAASTSPVTITYSTSSSEAPSIQQVIPTNGSPVVLPVVYNYFLVTYNDESPSVTYEVYPKYQLTLPVTTRYNSTDATLISNIGFNDAAESAFTISVTPSP